METELGIVIVSQRKSISDAALRSLAGLHCEGFACVNANAFDLASAALRDGDSHPVLDEVRERAVAYLRRQTPQVRARIFLATSLDDAGQQILAHAGALRLGMCIAESRAIVPGAHTANCLAAAFDEFFANVEAGGVATLRIPDSVVVTIPADDYRACPHQGSITYRLRVEPDAPEVPEDAWMLDADFTLFCMNYLQLGYTNALAHRRLRRRNPDASLGIHLAELMQSRFGADWLLSYYTGSIVSTLIKTAQHIADERGVLSIRGPNEHSLACASFINWRLYRRGYLMILTSAMIDELKGTLANLQQSEARGIIVCGDSLPGKWFGFQATLNSDADIRKVLAARHIPFVYLEDGEDIAEGVALAASLLDHAAGPVVVVAAQGALEATAVTEPSLPAVPPGERGAIDAEADAGFATAMRIINTEPAHLFWQCGALSIEERDLVLEIAGAAGIALGDALSAPGFLPSYRDGQRVPNYLGMLGQYGTNRAVYDFFQTGADFNPLESQCLFVLKGKLGQIDSPFSDSAHVNKLRIVQVNRRAEHIAPFADVGLVMPLIDFLRAVRGRLEVSPAVLALRRDKLERLRQLDQHMLHSRIPSLPMHPQYFFAQLAGVLESLIVERGYRYTGMFDVGHCATLAVSTLPRTDPSYSGWYGRGLMGDALLGAAALAVTGRGNVIAIVGDGAKHIVPDIVPNLVENLQARGKPIGKNVTIFYLMNNALSVINSYQERIMCAQGGRQMVIANREEFAEPDTRATIAGTTLVRQRMLHFDAAAITDALLEPDRINLFTLPVAPNNEGIAIVDRGRWEYGGI